MRILVTGANGFIGGVLCRDLAERGFKVRGAVRKSMALPSGVETIPVGSMDEDTDWSSALENVDCVIHLAARVHVMSETAIDPLSEFRKVNVEGTKKLAYSSARAGVKRLVYVSSVKVNGEATARPFTEEDEPAPQDPYGISKLEAEQALCKISEETGLEIVILRPPLVYGPGVGGNFVKLLQWIEKGLPFPLGSVMNRRSMIYVENLVHALIHCANHPDAKGEAFLVADRETISTPDLIFRLSEKMNRKARVLAFPVSILAFFGKIAGKSAEIERLTCSLEIDSSKIMNKLGWIPPFSLEDGFEKTVLWFQKRL